MRSFTQYACVQYTQRFANWECQSFMAGDSESGRRMIKGTIFSDYYSNVIRNRVRFLD